MMTPGEVLTDFLARARKIDPAIAALIDEAKRKGMSQLEIVNLLQSAVTIAKFKDR